MYESNDGIELQFLYFKDGRLTVELRRHLFMCLWIARGPSSFFGL